MFYKTEEMPIFYPDLKSLTLFILLLLSKDGYNPLSIEGISFFR